MFELLAIVSVDKEKRVFCKCPGCTKTVYAQIHIVRKDGKITVYGSACFKKEYGEYSKQAPKFSFGDQRRLTEEERILLDENTEKLIEKFESEIPPPVEIKIEQPKALETVQAVVPVHVDIPKKEGGSTRTVMCHYCKKLMTTTLTFVPAKGYKCSNCKGVNDEIGKNLRFIESLKSGSNYP